MSTENLSPAKRALIEIKQLRAQLEAVQRGSIEPIAIIGMGCRYPGAPGITEFWDLLINGRDAISEAPKSRWDLDAVYDRDPGAPGKMSSRKGGFVPHLEEFDAAFFGITPREAPYVDPRQRLMLEIAWEALENAGIPPDSLTGTPTGVYLATLTSDYSDILMRDLRRAEGYSGPGTANCVIANRISYFLDLHGPSITVDTACSGSLVALHMACESLRSGQTSMALAGGVSVNLLARSNVFFTKAGALSPDGRCNTFDERANGMIRSDGAGIVVLKRLSAAQAAGDTILALIRGSAMNHDGRSNGIMAPNGEAQRAVLRDAYSRAGVSPADVQYVEAHGTGTRLGDPIEVRALGDVLGPERDGRTCVLGSVKTNIGHSESAAGVAGVIATVLAMQHRLLPPTVHFERPNPLIPFGELPFEVRRKAGPWPQPDRRRIAAVSGFGFGGSNAHVVLEEAPERNEAANEPPPPYLLPISARSPQALYESLIAYCDHLTNPGATCYTASVRRSHHTLRIAVTGSTADDLRAALDRRLAEARDGVQPEHGRLAFVFSGQGSHWPGMGRQCYERFPVFREALDQVSELFAAHTGWRLIDELLKDEAASKLNDTEYAQPGIFGIQTALAALWASWGIVPDVVIGHSLGEAAAAVAAGTLSREDGVRVVFHRSQLMKKVAGKGMTAVVGLPLDRAAEAIRGQEDRLAVAGSNGPTTSVLAGDPYWLRPVLAMLEAKGVFCRPVAGVDIAFHSPQMDPLRHELVAALAGITPRASRVPMVSTVTGQPIDGASLGADYWGRNLRDPFLFTTAMSRVLADGCSAVLEVAPHAVLSSAIMQGVRQSSTGAKVLQSMRRNENEIAALSDSLGTLYELGRDVTWSAFYPSGGPTVSLPAYPWQREHFYLDQLPGGGPEEQSIRPSGSHPLLGRKVEAATGDASRMYLWEIDLSSTHPAWLADHRVMGEVILPGAACLEMALAAYREVTGGHDTAVTDVVFEKPCRLSKGEPCPIQLVITLRAGESEFALYFRAGEWVRFAKGKLPSAMAADPAAPPASSTDLAAIRGRCSEAVVVAAHYDAMQGSGLDYGPSFRLIRQLWRGGHEAVAEIAPATSGADARYLVHPALLDAAFQSVASVLSADPSLSYLPSGIASWQVFTPAPAGVLAHVTLRGQPGDMTLEADIELLNERGGKVARVDALRLSRTGMVRGRSLTSSLLEVAWTPIAAPDLARAPGRWLIVADRSATAEQLQSALIALGHEAIVVRCATPGDPAEMCRLVAPAGSITGAIHLLSLDASTAALDDAVALGCGSALHLAQALIEASPETSLWMVTRGAQAVGCEAVAVEQSGIWGLGLVIAQEHPTLRGCCIDLDPADVNGAGTILREILGPDREDRVVWRQGVRYGARLVRAAVPDAIEPRPKLSPDRSILITGGFGALGLATARLLVAEGARHLILAGRTGGEGKEREVAELETAGARVLCVRADMASAESVTNVMREIGEKLPPLGGVIHSAGVLDDGVLTQQSIDRFRTVMNPKVLGAWNLHQATKDLPLGFFIQYSSAASLLGSPGQANYASANAFLDALAHHRRALGLPALSINWGAWGGGMAESTAARRRQEANGVQAIDPSQGLDLLARMLDGEWPAQIGVFPVNWNTFGAQFRRGVPPLLENLVAAPAQPATVREAWTDLAGPDLVPTLRRLVRAELASVLGVGDPARVPTRQGFFEIGMDSLMAVELINRLSSNSRISLPANLAIDYPNVEALVSYLADRMTATNVPVESELARLSTEEIADLLAGELRETN